MHQRPAELYLQADVLPPHRGSIDWQHKPCQFKLYAEGTRLLLPYQGSHDLDDPSFTLGQMGEFLADLYGLLQQYYFIPLAARNRGIQPPEFSLAFRRVVPSGGALFPCEVYLFAREGHDLPAGVYHYDVAHHALDLLHEGGAVEAACAQLAYPGRTPPACLIALSCLFWKDGFKYGAFSYRLQGFDLGTIIAQCLALLNRRTLSATVHYQFLDAGVNELLGLDPLHESVYAVIALDQQRPQQSICTRQQTSKPAVINASGAPKLPSIARWPLAEAVHRAACIETREQFREQRCLPPLLAPISGTRYALPPMKQEIDILERYQQRHSARPFLPKPISAYHLGLLCRLSLAGYQNDVDGESTTLQHTLLYCVVNRVEGIPPGIYAYDPHKHTCELVVVGDMCQELQAVQRVKMPNMQDCSVCFFAVGNYATGFQHYGDRWYRMQNMEAGILVQRLYLVAAALQLGCRASLGFYISATHKLLALPENQDALIEIMVGPETPPYACYEQPLC